MSNEIVHIPVTYFENDIKTVAKVEVVGESDTVIDNGSTTFYEILEGQGEYTAYPEGEEPRTTVLKRGNSFVAFRGVPYNANGTGPAGMVVVAVSYPPFDPSAVTVVE